MARRRARSGTARASAARRSRAALRNSSFDEADRTASAVGCGSSRACKCRWAPCVRGHDPGQGQLPVSTIKAPGYHAPDARGSTCPGTNVGGPARPGNVLQPEKTTENEPLAAGASAPQARGVTVLSPTPRGVNLRLGGGANAMAFASSLVVSDAVADGPMGFVRRVLSARAHTISQCVAQTDEPCPPSLSKSLANARICRGGVDLPDPRYGITQPATVS